MAGRGLVSYIVPPAVWSGTRPRTVPPRPPPTSPGILTAVEDPPTVALAAGAALLFALAAVLVLLLHALPTGHDPVRHGVSAYAVGTYGRYYRSQVVATGIGSLLLVLAVAREPGPPGGRLVLLTIFGVSRIAIARYPTDLEGEALTWSGRIHIVLASIAFIALAIAAPLVSSWLVGGAVPGARVAGLDTAVTILGVAVPLAAAGTFAAGLPSLRLPFGIVERLFYVAALAWLLAASLEVVLSGG